tara:strand:- start:1747 stop:2340 length:594 start_codon:yes stop_codon:yes gene_type:complete
MTGSEINQAVELLAKLPGLGPRSARRAILHLLKRKETLLLPLADALTEAAKQVRQCSHCGNLDTTEPCGLCLDISRDRSTLCVVEEVADLWALNRSGIYRGLYHVLGGTLSALDGIGPEDLNIARLIKRAQDQEFREIILATGATVDGQTTAHYIAEQLNSQNIQVSRLAHGVPVGGELDYLDDGTLITALNSRRPF